MTEFMSYVKWKISKIFKRSFILNFQTFYFLATVIAAYGGYMNNVITVLTGLLLVLGTAIVHDYKNGYWKGERRKEMGRLTQRDLRKLKKEYKEDIKDEREDREQQPEQNATA